MLALRFMALHTCILLGSFVRLLFKSVCQYLFRAIYRLFFFLSFNKYLNYMRESIVTELYLGAFILETRDIYFIITF